MDFRIFKNKLANNFTEMVKDASHLFEIEVDKDELWNLYLDSFPAGTNNLYRERTEHDCSACRYFIKAIGNAVVIKNNQIITIWDFDTGSDGYQPVVNALSNYVKFKDYVKKGDTPSFSRPEC